MDDPTLDPYFLRLAEQTPTEFQALWRRARYTLRRYLNEGVWGFLLGMLFLVLSATCLRSAWSTWSEYKKAVNDEIVGVTAPNEPRQDEDRMGVLTSVLASLNSSSDLWTDLEESPVELKAREVRELVTEIQEAFLGIYQVAETLRAGHAGVCTWDGKVCGSQFEESANHAALGLDRRWGHASPDWVALMADRLVDYVHRPREPTRPYRSNYASNSVRHFGELAGRIDAVNPDCITVVPSLRRFLLWEAVSAGQAASGLHPSPGQPTHTDDAVHAEELDDRYRLSLSEREQRALMAGGFLVPTIRRFQARIAELQRPDYLSILQVYWVSPDSVFSLWQPTLAGRDIGTVFPPTKLWATSYYLQKLLIDGQSEYISPAYVDYAEGGIALTRSRAVRPVTNALAADQVINPTNLGQLAGAIVVDVGVPTEWFLRSLVNRAKLISVERVTITQRGSGNVEVSVKRPVRGGVFLPRDLRWDPVSPERQHWVEKALNALVGDPGLHRKVTPLDLEGVEEFLVPIGTSSDATRAALLVRFVTPSYPPSTLWAALLGFVFLAATMGAMLFAWRASIRSSELRAKVWLMSNLQVGVFSMGHKDEVLEANDRAMEIFAIELPKAGVVHSPGDLPIICFADLIEDLVIEAAEPRRVLKYTEHVPILRRKGVASCYYARIRGKSEVEWVRVWGTPILGRDPAGTSRRTFGIVEIVDDDKLRQDLDSRLHSARTGRSGSKTQRGKR